MGTTTATAMVVVLADELSPACADAVAFDVAAEISSSVVDVELSAWLLVRDVAVDALADAVRPKSTSGPGNANVSLLGFRQSNCPLP